MPFTPSHAVVALPFLRSPLVPAAVAVGAMTPDLPLFVRGMPLHYGLTHDVRWIAATMLLAFVLLLAWRCILRPVARELSPRRLASRLPSEWDAGAAASLRETLGVSGSPARVGWAGVALLVVSLAIGVASHVLWDLFTHEGRWGVSILPILDERWGSVHGYRWVQHGSSALGLAILAVWAVLWLRRRTPQPIRERALPDAVRWVWWASLPLVLLIAWGMGLATLGPLTDTWRVEHIAYRVLPPACAVWGAATIALATLVQARRRSLRRTGRSA